MTTATLPSSTGVVSSYSYDNADRLMGISHVQNGSTTIASVSYTLDAVGNRTQRVDQQGTHTYAYDNLYRLTSVTYPGPTTTSYAFDAFGNRTSITDGTGTTTYAYDDAERLTSVTPPTPAPVVNYTWDNNGDLTARGSDSFAWDYEDRMTSATVGGVTTTFTYRGDGLRNSRTTGGVTTGFTWDVNRGLPVVLDDGNRYVYGAGLASMVTATGTYYCLADGLGSTMAIVDTSGTVQKSYTYDVYGKPTATGSLANEFDFAGQQTDPTGLQYLRARYMDTATGTFISRDPLAAGPSWGQHPFSYVSANPVSLTDPTGQSWNPPHGPCFFLDEGPKCPPPVGCYFPNNCDDDSLWEALKDAADSLSRGWNLAKEYEQRAFIVYTAVNHPAAHAALVWCATTSWCRDAIDNALLGLADPNVKAELAQSPYPQLAILAQLGRLGLSIIWVPYHEHYSP